VISALQLYTDLLLLLNLRCDFLNLEALYVVRMHKVNVECCNLPVQKMSHFYLTFFGLWGFFVGPLIS